MFKRLIRLESNLSWSHNSVQPLREMVAQVHQQPWLGRFALRLVPAVACMRVISGPYSLKKYIQLRNLDSNDVNESLFRHLKVTVYYRPNKLWFAESHGNVWSLVACNRNNRLVRQQHNRNLLQHPGNTMKSVALLLGAAFVMGGQRAFCASKPDLWFPLCRPYS